MLTLKNHQLPIVDKIIHSPSAFIIAKMGAGKTSATLYALKHLFDNFAIEHVLIIAPKLVATDTWPNEVKKWAQFKDMDVAIAIGTPAQRKAAIAKRAMITIINRENIPWLINDHLKSKWFFDMVVIDESTSFKNPSSQRFKAMKKVRALTERVVNLTGTPKPNSYLDLWSQVFLLDGGERLGRAFHSYKQRWFESDYMGYNYVLKKGADEEIEARIKDLCVVIDTYSGLPNRVDLTETVVLSKKEANAYQQLKKKMILEIEDNDITALTAGALVGKLQQMANGAAYNEAGTPIPIHTRKLDKLEALLEHCEDENVIVVYNYKHDVERIKQRLKHAVEIKEKDAITRWNNKEIKLLLLHPASAGHGLNLWEGGRRLIWFGPTWSSEFKLQCDARLYRQGQTETTFIHTIVCEGTIDEDIMMAVENKVTLQNILIENLKK